MNALRPSRVGAGSSKGGQFATSVRGEASVSLDDLAPDASGPADDTAAAALAPALDMNRVEAEKHVRSLLDAAADDGDTERVEQIASLACGAGWRGAAALRSYPHTATEDVAGTDYLPTKAAATRMTDHAADRMRVADRVAYASQAQAVETPAPQAPTEPAANISVVTTPQTLTGHCAACGESKTAPNKGLGRAKLATWRTRHQHLDGKG